MTNIKLKELSIRLETTECHVKFMLGKKTYQYIKTIYDNREDGKGSNEIIVVYDYKAQNYACLNVSNIGDKEITIF